MGKAPEAGVLAETKAPTEAVDKRANAAHESGNSSRSLKRAASALSEDSASDSGGLDLGELLEQDKENEVALRSEQDERRLREEREWLRHKRRTMKKEAQGQNVSVQGAEDENTALFGATTKGIQRTPSFLRMNSGLSGRK